MRLNPAEIVADNAAWLINAHGPALALARMAAKYVAAPPEEATLWLGEAWCIADHDLGDASLDDLSTAYAEWDKVDNDDTRVDEITSNITSWQRPAQEAKAKTEAELDAEIAAEMAIGALCHDVVWQADIDANGDGQWEEALDRLVDGLYFAAEAGRDLRAHAARYIKGELVPGFDSIGPDLRSEIAAAWAAKENYLYSDYSNREFAKLIREATKCVK